MQKKIVIKTTDNKNIYWIFNNPENISKGLIIFVHWLTWSRDEDMFVHWEKYFNDKWYSTFRFNLYGSEKNGRILSETDLQDHIVDVDNVVKYFQEKWEKKIFLIGHSFWWLTILYSDLSGISSIILRDPSIGGKELLEDVVYNETNSNYVIDWWSGEQYPISDIMYRDFCIEPQIHLDKMAGIKLAVKIICAENGLKQQAEKYYKVANEPKKFAMVSGARHCFHEEWTEDILFDETYDWIRKYW